MYSGGTSGTSVMFVDSQLAQLSNPGIQPCSATTMEHACALCQDQTSALHMFFDTKESESCLVKAPATHASESVLVVGELLCTGVQANTERHTRKETLEMCSCWGYKQQRLHRGVLEGTSSTTMMVRWKLTRLSLVSCLQGWSISRMKWCSSATEVTDTRTLGNPKSSQTMLRNGQQTWQ